MLLSVKSAVFQPYYNYWNVIQCLFHVNVYNIFYFYIFRDMCTHWNYRIWSTTWCLSKRPKFLFCVLYYCSRWKLFVWISVAPRDIIFIWWLCIINNQDYKKIRLIRSFKKFIFRYQDLVEIYSVSAETIISDAFSYSENV